MLSETVPDPVEPGWRVIRLDADVRVLSIGTLPEADERSAQLVDAIWSEACRQRPELFDGQVFVADRINRDRIDGHWTPYRTVFAQLRHPEMFPPPHLMALAVNGLLRCADGLVLGRRRATAIYRAGCWQGVPAGSVEARDGTRTVDVAAQVIDELVEEIGLTAGQIGAIVPVTLMVHPGGRVADIGCLIATDLPFEAVEQAWRRGGNAEYDALQLVRPGDVLALLRHAGPKLLVSARILLECWLEQQDFLTGQRASLHSRIGS